MILLRGRGFDSYRGQANFSACPVDVLREAKSYYIYLSVCIITGIVLGFIRGNCNYNNFTYTSQRNISNRGPVV